MSERLPCKSSGCRFTILPSTAERTGGLCMPCVNAAAQAEHDRYVAENRVEVDRFRDVKDDVEHILLLHAPVSRVDPMKVYLQSPRSASELYGALTAADLDRLLLVAKRKPELLQKVGAHLAHFSPLPMGAVQRLLLAANLLDPPYVFRGASEEIVDDLIRRVDAKPSVLSPVFGALAWTRHPKAIATLLRSRSIDAPLEEDLARFTHAAGYELVDGRIRDLVSSTCNVISFASSPEGGRALRLFEPGSDAPCPRCGTRPWHLVHPPTLADSAVITTCPSCVIWGEVFAFRDFAKRGWMASVADPMRRALDFPPTEVRVGPSRSPFASVDWCVGEELSQVGGHPTWLNQPGYPACPTCASRMPFELQISLDQLGAEGLLYAFSCDACGIVATQFNQT